MNTLTQYFSADTQNYHGILDERFHDLAVHFSRLQDARTDQGGAALAVYFGTQKLSIFLRVKNLVMSCGMPIRFLSVTQLVKAYLQHWHISS